MKVPCITVKKKYFGMEKRVFTLGSLYRRPAAQTCTSPERKLMRMHCAAEISWHFSMSILRSCTESSTLMSWLTIRSEVSSSVQDDKPGDKMKAG